MKPLNRWDRILARLHAGQDAGTSREEERLRHELRRLLAIGEHLIRDIGLDPEEVRRWLEESRGQP